MPAARARSGPRTPYCRGVTLVLLVRHGLTATTGGVLTGWTPGIPLDDRGRGQAAALAARLAPMRLDAIISSPLERCRQTAEAIAGPDRPQVREDDRLGECHYGRLDRKAAEAAGERAAVAGRPGSSERDAIPRPQR